MSSRWRGGAGLVEVKVEGRSWGEGGGGRDDVEVEHKLELRGRTWREGIEVMI